MDCARDMPLLPFIWFTDINDHRPRLLLRSRFLRCRACLGWLAKKMAKDHLDILYSYFCEACLCKTTERGNNTLQTLFRFLGDGMELLVAHHTQHGLGVGNVNPAPLAERAHDHIARQEQANVWLLLECAMCQWWIAGPENDIGFHLGTQFLTERLAYIYLGQHTESLGLESLLHTRDRFFIGHVQGCAKTIGCVHRSFLLLSSGLSMHC